MMTDDEYLKSLGFAGLDGRPGVYEKIIVCCNSVCIGCEYHIGILVYANYADSYYKMNCYLCKPPATDAWHDDDGEEGGIILPVVDTERKRLEQVIADAVIAVCRIMSALDMRQISGFLLRSFRG